MTSRSGRGCTGDGVDGSDNEHVRGAGNLDPAEIRRAIDHDIATGVWPDMTEHDWDVDEWPAIFERVNVLYSLQHLGYAAPPQADAGWIGEAGPGPSYLDPGSGGPENDFTNRNTTFMTYNLLHLAAMLRSGGASLPTETAAANGTPVAHPTKTIPNTDRSPTRGGRTMATQRTGTGPSEGRLRSWSMNSSGGSRTSRGSGGFSGPTHVRHAS